MAMKPFADVIRDYRNGQLHEKLSDELAQMIRRCVAVQRPGELTIKFKVKIDKDQVKLSATSTLKLPAEVEVGDAVFFPDEDGGLHRSDPRQGELPIVRDTAKRKDTVQ